MKAPSPGHAALMDRIYRYQRHFYNLTRKYYLFGRDRMIGELRLSPDERLVEIGCGTARNLIAIAKRYPKARLFGLDASQEMLKTAECAVSRAGLSERIRLVHGLAENLTPATFGETAPFDRALFSYSLSMIPDWPGAIAAAASALASGGRLHVVDFGDFSGLGRLGKFLLLSWLKAFHVAPREELIRAFEGGNIARMHLLPGRYAFLLEVNKEDTLQGVRCCKPVTEGH
jgi:S-adenosylmethionine-diacylgycerolhomoserine-N-methlytransferase